MTENKNYETRWWVEKPGRGRPKKEDAEKKSVILQIRVTEEEREAVSKAAEAAGKTLSEWMREKVLGNG